MRDMTGLTGLVVTASVIELVLIVTGDTHRAVEVSEAEIMSPFARLVSVIDVNPLVAGIIELLRYHVMDGAEPGLVFVIVKLADSSEQNCVFGVPIIAECVIFGETIIVTALDAVVNGDAQPALEVSLAVMTSLLFKLLSVTEVWPLVPGMITAFLNQLITGELPPLLAVSVNVAD